MCGNKPIMQERPLSRQIATQTKPAMRPALQKRSREKAERMLKAGHKLIEAHGYEGMRISAVAAEAGCSVGIFYDRFNDKETFFRLLLDDSLTQTNTRIDTYLQVDRWRKATAHEIVSAVVSDYVGWFQRNKGLYSAALSTPIEGGKNFIPFRKQFIRLAERLTDVLAAHSTELNCEDLRMSVWFAVQMMNGTLVVAGFSDLAVRAGARISDDKSIAISDPEMIHNITRAFCSFLGIAPPKPANPGSIQ
jgi:AcrR family transcriptional regulator